MENILILIIFGIFFIVVFFVKKSPCPQLSHPIPINLHREHPPYRVEVDGDRICFTWDDVKWSPGQLEVTIGHTPLVIDPATIICKSNKELIFARGQIDEIYLFKKGYIEQIFIVHQKPQCKGALTIRTRPRTNLKGSLIKFKYDSGWQNDIEMKNGGLWFTEASGRPILAYYDAIATDATGRKIYLDIGWNDGQIILTVPEIFLAEAKFPLIIDPWIKLAGGSRFPSIAIDSFGNLFVCWENYTYSNLNIYLKRWNGLKWMKLGRSTTGGGISKTTGNSSFSRLAIDSSNNPVVTWHDSTSGNLEIYLKRWNGKKWVELGGSASGGGISNNAGKSLFSSLAIDSLGNPIVAWHDDTSGKWNIYLKKWNGTKWVELGGSASGGGISNSSGCSRLPSLSLDYSGNPIVAYVDNISSRDDIYVKRWHATSWLEIGKSVSSNPIVETIKKWIIIVIGILFILVLAWDTIQRIK